MTPSERPLSRWRFAATWVAFVTGGLCVGASASEPIVIGQSLPLYGTDSDGRAEQTLAGSTALVAAVNAGGGIGGRSLQLVTLNNDNDLQVHRSNLRSLVREHKAVAVLNCLGEAQCRVAAEEATALQVPLVGVLAGAAELVRAKQPRVFRIRATHDREAEALARYLQAMTSQKVALLVDDSDSLSTAAAAVQAALARHGLQNRALRLGDNNAETIGTLMQLERDRFDAVVMLARPDAVARVVSSGLDQRPEWPRLITALAQGARGAMFGGFTRRQLAVVTVVPNPERATLPLTRELQQAAEAKGGPVAVTAAGLEAYIAAKLVAEALRRTPRATSAALFNTLDTLPALDLGGDWVHLSPSRASAADFIDIELRGSAKGR